MLNELHHKINFVACPKFNLPFETRTDDFDFQLGSVIAQDGRPLPFYSRKLNASQRRHTLGERELFAIVETT